MESMEIKELPRKRNENFELKKRHLIMSLKQKHQLKNNGQNTTHIWCMEIENKSHGKILKCNCPAFFENYIYKHVVDMAISV